MNRNAFQYISQDHLWEWSFFFFFVTYRMILWKVSITPPKNPNHARRYATEWIQYCLKSKIKLETGSWPFWTPCNFTSGQNGGFGQAQHWRSAGSGSDNARRGDSLSYEKPDQISTTDGIIRMVQYCSSGAELWVSFSFNYLILAEPAALFHFRGSRRRRPRHSPYIM